MRYFTKYTNPQSFNYPRMKRFLFQLTSMCICSSWANKSTSFYVIKTILVNTAVVSHKGERDKVKRYNFTVSRKGRRTHRRKRIFFIEGNLVPRGLQLRLQTSSLPFFSCTQCVWIFKARKRMIAIKLTSWPAFCFNGQSWFSSRSDFLLTVGCTTDEAGEYRKTLDSVLIKKCRETYIAGMISHMPCNQLAILCSQSVSGHPRARRNPYTGKFTTSF